MILGEECPHIDDERLVKDWVVQQPAPRSGLLEASYIEEGEWRPRLVFERPIGDNHWSTDPILEDVAQYLAAWLDDTAVECASGNRPRYLVSDDPRDVCPGSAWLLKGSEASFPTSTELHRDRAAANVGIFTRDWTTASQTQTGDLVLIYFISPRKAVHFVARAASNAFVSRDIAVKPTARSTGPSGGATSPPRSRSNRSPLMFFARRSAATFRCEEGPDSICGQMPSPLCRFALRTPPTRQSLIVLSRACWSGRTP